MILIKIFKKIKFAKKVFSENKGYLMPGKYYLQDNCRVFYHNEAYEIRESFINAKESYWLTKMILTFFNVFGFFHVSSKKKKNSDTNCTVVYIANNHDKKREIKLFDFSKNRVIVLAISEQAKKEKEIIYQTLHKIYSMPRISNLDSCENNKYSESLIRKKPLPESDDYFRSICIAHSRLVQQKSDKTVILKSCFEKSYDDRITNNDVCEFLNELNQRISEDVLKARDVCVIQHGDLSINNLLYGYADGKNDFWWIDWEHLNLRPFYYDVFFFMVNSAVCEGDYTFTEAYLAGTYDDCLKNLFSAYNVNFFSEKKNEYLYLYMLDFVSERLCRRVSISALEKYRRYVYLYFCN